MAGPEVEASKVELSGDSAVDQDRRAFLLRYGKVALVAPPVITTLLATSMSSSAIAQSTGGGGGGGNAWLFGAGALPLAAIPARQAPALVPLAQPAPPPPPVAAPAPVAAPPAPPENYRVGERG